MFGRFFSFSALYERYYIIYTALCEHCLEHCLYLYRTIRTS